MILCIPYQQVNWRYLLRKAVKFSNNTFYGINLGASLSDYDMALLVDTDKIQEGLDLGRLCKYPSAIHCADG